MEASSFCFLPRLPSACKQPRRHYPGVGLVQDGLGKDDGRLHKKPPSLGRIIQNSVRASSRLQIYSFIYCLTYSFTHLFNRPFAHSFTDWCIHPTVTEWLAASPDALLSPGDKMVHKTLLCSPRWTEEWWKCGISAIPGDVNFYSLQALQTPNHSRKLRAQPVFLT